MVRPENISYSDWEVIKNYRPLRIKRVIKKINSGYPIQYLIGNVNFYQNKICVNKHVLIPRFETELLVDKCLMYFKDYNKELAVLEIGTGSGCIAISLYKKIKSRITATDISKKALKVAKKNAKLNQVKIDFINQDIFKNEIKGEYDLVISNPPYISYSDTVDDKIKYEPQTALYTNQEGLAFYEEIIKKTVGHVTQGGLIAFEIGNKQGQKVRLIAEKYYQDSQILIEKDYSDRERFLFIFVKKP